MGRAPQHPLHRRWQFTLSFLLALAFMLPAAAVRAAEAPSPAGGVGEHLRLVVFVRDGCPHCADAKAYLSGLTAVRPKVEVVYRPIDRDPAAREELAQVSQRAGIWPPGVPTFVARGKVKVGFGDAAESGPDLLAFIDDTHAQPTDEVNAGPFGALSPTRLGLPLFTLAIGLIDGFNPCATWVLLFLLSLLVHLRDRRRMALVAGTFVIASGAVYYAFMAAWLSLFLAVGMSAPLRWTLAALAIAIGAINTKDFFAWKRGISLTIPEGAKPGLYTRLRTVMNAENLPAALVAVTLLAIAVNFIELLCTAGLPAIYTAILAQRDLGWLAYHAYLGLYIAGYIADDTLLVTTAVVALSSTKLSEQNGRWLKLVSGIVMLALGVLMLLRPDLLG